MMRERNSVLDGVRDGVHTFTLGHDEREYETIHRKWVGFGVHEKSHVILDIRNEVGGYFDVNWMTLLRFSQEDQNAYAKDVGLLPSLFFLLSIEGARRNRLVLELLAFTSNRVVPFFGYSSLLRLTP